MQTIVLVTTNQKRAEKYQNRFKDSGLTVSFITLDQETPELQGTSGEEVAIHSAQWAAKTFQTPVIKEDSSFEIPALNRFPSIYVKHMNQWLGAEGYIKLMQEIEDRRSCWINVLCYATPDGTYKTFTSKTWGTIATQPSEASVPNTNWSIDKIWIPNGFDTPIAEISPEVRKMEVWKGDTFQQFIDWYQTTQITTP